jgi:hypothetical protein
MTGVRVLVILYGCLGAFPVSAASEEPNQVPTNVWAALTVQVAEAGLPTRFLAEIPDKFVRVEFEDLQAYAAEYHPTDHRMVLNRTLSFNAAGRTLRPVKGLSRKELETLYHELFHAYVDYLTTDGSLGGKQSSLVAFARAQQACRYQDVQIVPVAQQRNVSEQRYLSDRESWDALNETWAVFVGWDIWTRLGERLHVGEKGDSPHAKRKQFHGWLRRLMHADLQADLRGYYEPEDQVEQQMARKRYLAPEFRISSPEVEALMRSVLEYPAALVQEALQALAANRMKSGPIRECRPTLGAP